MIRLLIMIIIGVISVSSSAHAESRMHTEEMSEPERPIADSDIKDAFLAALSSRPCGNGIVNAYAHAVRLCGEDSRRRARIVVEIAREDPGRVPWALSELSVCGSREDVPFICEWTNDVRYVANAAHALICIEGVTSNTIAYVSRAMDKEDVSPGKRYALCSAIARMAEAEKGDPLCKALAISALKRYAKTIPVTSLWADEFLLTLDPLYETSEERKVLLRGVADRRVNDYQLEYATNALKKIEKKLSAKVGFAASAYTNMQQLVNVRITPEVLAQMPTNDFSSPQMTVLCFERAMRSGDCTNLFNCCSLEYNLRNLGITNVSQISATKIAEAQNFVTNLQDCINVKVLEETISSSNVVIKVKVHESSQGRMIESGDRFDVRYLNGQWKIHGWDDILEKGW